MWWLALATGLRLTSEVAGLDRVVTLLENLVKQIDAESEADERDYTAFVSWDEAEQASTEADVARLGVKLPEVAASVAQLAAAQQAKSQHVASLGAELAREQGSLAEAQQKRADEHQEFLAEQQDFQNSINACSKAVTLLGDKYTVQEDAARPDWMSLLRVATSRLRLSQPSGAMLHNVYQESTAEGQNIVTLVKDLAQTFEQDKMDASDAEASVQRAFDGLEAQKQGILAAFVQEHDAQQATLTTLNQQLSEQQGLHQQTQTDLASAHEYLDTLAAQRAETKEAYEARKKDQAAEREAVTSALRVVQSATPAFAQLRARTLLQLPDCRTCDAAAALLRRRSRSLRSGLLATAAQAAGVGATLQPLVEDLHGLITRLDEEQASEEKHRAWCDAELAATAQKRVHHEGLLAGLTQAMADTQAAMEEKRTAIEEHGAELARADASFADITQRREQAHADFEAEQQDYVDAVAALQEAVTMLTEFYRATPPELVQVPRRDTSLSGVYARMRPARRVRRSYVQMPSLSAAYKRKGGEEALQMIEHTLAQFESGKADHARIETREQEAYEGLSSEHTLRRQAMEEAGVQLTAELQSAAAKQASDESSRAASEAEIASAHAYLEQVGQSCGNLVSHFEDRTELRKAEKTALEDAIAVLSG